MGILLATPASLALLAVLVVPTVIGFLYSFTKLSFVNPEHFGTIDNWRGLANVQLSSLIVRTVIFVVCSVALTILISLPIARFLDRLTRRMSTLLQLIVIVPWVMSSIVASLLFRWVMLQDIGLVGYIFDLFGITWSPLLSPTWGMVSTIIVASWRTAGFAVLLLLAGLKSVDPTLYESARVDGASPIKEFFYVAIPSIRTQLTIVFVILFMSNLNNVEVPLTITNGGPAGTTMIVSLKVYQMAFSDFNFGGSTALASATMAINIVLVLVYLRYTLRKG